MIETLISSKTRIKLLLKFFLNSETTSYLRGLETEFGESTNSIRLELNRLEEAGMLSSYSKGNKKIFKSNTSHPLYKEVHNILLKYIGFDKIIIGVVERLGDVQKVFVTGEFAKGLDSQIIDLVFIGDVNKQYLIQLIEKTEKLIHRKIRYIVYKEEEETSIDWSKLDFKPLLLWSNET
ncbi:MAG: ArsR family transcriptional regulator [Saprospiraceae bacterium]|nr:ArsR family transcriptional regulator [Saprospiraceae bacterium]